jgi:hypothetical protein
VHMIRKGQVRWLLKGRLLNSFGSSRRYSRFQPPHDRSNPEFARFRFSGLQHYNLERSGEVVAERVCASPDLVHLGNPGLKIRLLSSL